jgi:ADP-ribosylglycohydrolase
MSDSENIIETPQKIPFDKLKGLLIGGALGDALGAPHEFRHLKHNIYSGKLEYQAYTWNRFTREKTYLDIGQITDDTEMSICLLNSIIENKGEYCSRKAVMEYLAWANSGTVFMGRNTRYLFKGIKTYKGYTNRFEKMKTPENNQSNGALMRCGILAIYGGQDNFLDIVKSDCEITNPNEISVICNTILLQGIYACFFLDNPKKKSKIIEIIEKTTNWEIWRNWNTEELSVNGKDKGWCVYGLVLAYKALEKFNSFQEGIDWIISKGGDTDTNACIGGYLLGAFYGYEKMVQNSGVKENVDILFSCNTKKATNPRPKKYLVKNTLTNFNISLVIVMLEKLWKNK